jgi:hypothetical protein
MTSRSLRFAALFATLLVPALGQTPDGSPSKDEEKKKLPKVRFVCVAALKEDDEVILASRDSEGKWQELGTVKLRSSFISDWFPAIPGQLHLAVREGTALKSICAFNYPAGCRRAMVVLLPDSQKNTYRADVLDPEKMAFRKGSVLAINFSKTNGFLLLGTKKITIPAGQRVVTEPAVEGNGMYRMMVAYEDSKKQAVPCYDRYIPGNPDSRDMLFLFPDQALGLKVFCLPMFGELD